MGVVIIILVGVRTGHGVGRERGEVIPAAVTAVAVVWVVSAGSVVRMMGGEHAALAFDLGCGGGQHVDGAVIRAPSLTPAVVSHAGSVVLGVAGKGVRRGDVGRANGGGRGGSRHVLVGRGHHLGHGGAVLHAILDGLVHLLCLVTPSRVGVVVYPRVAGQLVGAGEAFGAAVELAGVRLLAGMGANVSGLMLETVEGFIAQGTLVGSGQILSVLAVLAHGHGHHLHGRHLRESLLFVNLR